MGGSFKWPPLSEVLEYRRQVRELVISIIETAPLELPITQDHPWVCPYFLIEYQEGYNVLMSLFVLSDVHSSQLLSLSVYICIIKCQN